MDASDVAFAMLFFVSQEQHLEVFAPHSFFSHTIEHFGRGQVNGLRQFHLQSGLGHLGAHSGSSRSHLDLQTGSKQTFSQTGHPSSPQSLLEQRIWHCGFEHTTSHLGALTGLQVTSQSGLAHSGSHSAGHEGLEHCQVHVGRQSGVLLESSSSLASLVVAATC